jgi:hypothetical protein
MMRLARWFIIAGLLVLIYWQAGIVDSHPASPGEQEDWRGDVGLLVVFAATAFYFVLSYLSAMKQRRPIADADPRAEIVISTSKVVVALLVVPVIGGVAGAYLLFSAELTSPTSLLLAFSGAVLAFLAAILMALHLACGPFRLSLSETGLDYAPFKCGPIAWKDVRAAEVKRTGRRGFVSLDVADHEKYFARGFPKKGRKLGSWFKTLSSPFAISPQLLQASPEAILGAIKARLALFGRAADTKDNS